MIEVISGEDWSCSNKDNKIKSRLSFGVSNNDENKSVDETSDDRIEGREQSSSVSNSNTNEIIINPYDYFPVWSSLFGHSDMIKPRNLGVYLEKTKDDWKIHSTQFVGIMPLTDNKFKPFKYNDEQCVIKIDSRFHILPSKMLKEVLDGDDYYENPDMLQCNSYKLSELGNLYGRNKKNKVLCGTVSDIGKVTLKQIDVVNGDKRSELDSFLSGAYPIFEIIRFVNLAKEVCKKNLKKQSVFKEENLVGKVKGRILVNQQIKQNISRGQYHKTYCTYNALSENIKENMILKYTLHLCSKFEIADSLREDIMFCNRVLADVPLKKCSISDFVGLKCNGVFRQYKQAMEAAKVIIKRYYISYDQSVKDDSSKNEKEKIIVADYSVEPYFIDMNLLFEYYCRALFRKAINKYNQKSSNYILEMDSATRGNIKLFKDENKVKAYYMPTYIPDILIKYRQKDKNEDKDNKILTVIDAKYSDVEHSEKRARTHQVLFYMNVLNCDYGGLISPSTNEKLSEKKLYLMDSYLYDGKEESRQKLCYLPLALNGKYDEMISNYLEEIMEKRIQTDKKEQKQAELEVEVKEIVKTIKEGVTDKGFKRDMKNKLLEWHNKVSVMIDNSEENTKGE